MLRAFVFLCQGFDLLLQAQEVAKAIMGVLTAMRYVLTLLAKQCVNCSSSKISRNSFLS